MRIRGLIFYLFFATMFVTLSCKWSHQKGEDVVALVNDAPIVAEELK